MRWSTIGREILVNSLMSVPAIRRARVSAGRTTGSGADKFQSRFREIEPELGELAGARVVELGPGDIVPMAWELFNRGASSYVAIDRFGGNIDTPGARAVYDALGAPEEFPTAFVDDGRIVYDRSPAESFEIGAPPADLVLSIDVLEHVSNLTEVFRASYRALRPGGRSLHYVDLSPHAQWRKATNPLEFLTVSDTLWSMMGSHRGLPNRFRCPDFRQSLEDVGFRVDRFEPRGVFAQEDVETIRPRLIERLRAMPTEELMPSRLLIVATRPD